MSITALDDCKPVDSHIGDCHNVIRLILRNRRRREKIRAIIERVIKIDEEEDKRYRDIMGDERPPRLNTQQKGQI